MDTVIFTGRFGSGKTETAINYALSLARKMPEGAQSRASAGQQHACGSHSHRPGHRDSLLPLAGDGRQAPGLGVEVIAPSIIGQHLDTPAITPQILGAIQQSDRPVVLDVGGDRGRAGTGAIQRGHQPGRLYHALCGESLPAFHRHARRTGSSIAEIEASARLKVTSLVSNPNLIGETTMEHIVQGHAKIERFARALGLPIAFVCVERRWIDALAPGISGESASAIFSQPMLILDRYFVMPWE